MSLEETQVDYLPINLYPTLPEEKLFSRKQAEEETDTVQNPLSKHLECKRLRRAVLDHT